MGDGTVPIASWNEKSITNGENYIIIEKAITDNAHQSICDLDDVRHSTYILINKLLKDNFEKIKS